MAKKKKQKQIGPKSRNRHWLYQMSVQSPDINARFFDRVYKKRNGKLPGLLKEDFCGTAILAAEWVRMRPDNEAVGVDLDGPTLTWGEKNNVEPLKEDASRVKLIRADVRSVTEPKVDVVSALNFSYCIFKTPKKLQAYFEAVRSSLKSDGIFILDIFGGWEAQQELVDKTKYKGFTYQWQQKDFNPVTHEGLYCIHFKFHGGGGIRKAFVYDWRLWGIPEVRDALQAAGFRDVDVYLEGVDPEDGEGNGVFRKVTKMENCPGWNAFIVAG